MIANFDAHAANERTFLAWIRTVMAVVGFGLAAARLGDQPAAPWSEAVLLAVGGFVIVISYVRMRKLRRRIDVASVYDDDVESGDRLLLLLLIGLFVLIAVFFLHIL